MSENQIQLPKYRSHKEVWALKIASVIRRVRSTILQFEEAGYGDREFDLVEMQKLPAIEPGWYMVVYADGYTSFSPAKAFEEGYTRITP